MPEANGLIIATGGQMSRIVGNKTHRPDASLMSQENLSRLTGFHIPQPDRLVITPREQPLTTRIKCQAHHSPGMASECGEQCARPHLPDADRAVITASGKELPIRGEGKRKKKDSRNLQEGRKLPS